jgi:hypothetical protein
MILQGLNGGGLLALLVVAVPGAVAIARAAWGRR